MPMGAAAMAYTLWTRYLKHNPRDPRWANPSAGPRETWRSPSAPESIASRSSSGA